MRNSASLLCFMTQPPPALVNDESQIKQAGCVLPGQRTTVLQKQFSPPQAFSSFSATGGDLNDILGNVGAIQMEIDATAVAQEGWDMRMD